MDQPRRAKAAAARTARQPVATPRGLEAYVLVASFVVGGIILVVEILGTRVIGPYYGASIYVWSSLIGVTLGALTAGYIAGGWVADMRLSSGGTEWVYLRTIGFLNPGQCGQAGA